MTIPGRGAPTVPWVIWAVLGAATSAVIGVVWDISWHRSIGRDTFWTPAHMAIYLGGVVAGLSCGWVALKTTFAGTPEEQATSVRLWGFRAPLGAWVCIWGSFAMIVSAPFDNWWHDAYGLDVKVISPPHVILALGFLGIELGALLMVLARQNRAAEGSATAFGWLYAYAAGILLLNNAVMGFEYIAFPNDMHHASFYKIAAGALPLALVATGRASKLRWPATAAAAVYMGIMLIMIWVLQLFPATPKLAPIYTQITHMVPPPFPLLLVVPAVGVDLVMRHMSRERDWLLALGLAAAFVALLLAAQWWFAEFLISPKSENFFFGTGRWNYNSRPLPFRHEFWETSTDPLTAPALGIAVLFAFASARIGLWWGNWMARVMR